MEREEDCLGTCEGSGDDKMSRFGEKGGYSYLRGAECKLEVEMGCSFRRNHAHSMQDVGPDLSRITVLETDVGIWESSTVK